MYGITPSNETGETGGTGETAFSMSIKKNWLEVQISAKKIRKARFVSPFDTLCKTFVAETIRTISCQRNRVRPKRLLRGTRGCARWCKRPARDLCWFCGDAHVQHPLASPAHPIGSRPFPADGPLLDVQLLLWYTDTQGVRAAGQPVRRQQRGCDRIHVQRLPVHQPAAQGRFYLRKSQPAEQRDCSPGSDIPTRRGMRYPRKCRLAARIAWHPGPAACS
jgi:hypothetical protein